MSSKNSKYAIFNINFFYCTHCSLFLYNHLLFWKENLAHTLLISLWIILSSDSLFTYNSYSRQIILLVVKKPDAWLVPLCSKLCFMLEGMIQILVRSCIFEASASLNRYQHLVYLQTLSLLKIIMVKLGLNAFNLNMI